MKELLPIETNRLILRSLTFKDLNDSLEHRADKDVCKYISEPMNANEVLSFIKKSSENWNGTDNEKLAIGIEFKENNKIIGELMFKYVDKKNKIGEIGFRLNKLYQKKGIAKEASSALLDVLFNKANLNKITAICDVENINSFNLMEKLGMTKEAHFINHAFLNNCWKDQYQYFLLKSTWQKISN